MDLVVDVAIDVSQLALDDGCTLAHPSYHRRREGPNKQQAEVAHDEYSCKQLFPSSADTLCDQQRILSR